MLTVWGRKTSVNVQKPMWLLGELGLAVDRKDVGGAFGGTDTPAYIALNPHQLVPTLQDGVTTVWESEAILRYLGSLYGQQYFPADPRQRAGIDQWMSWVQSSWSPAMTAVFGSHIRVPHADRDRAVVAAQVERLNKLATLVDKLLASRQFLAGDALSLADFTFGAFLFRYNTLEIERPKLARLDAYYQSLCQRGPYVQHVQIDYEGMRVPGAGRSA